ncbi:hypothetical protein [Bacillus pumilus]|uniref:hypothetical protein n=1 Tax=Bacillus pumilus TaxID=1408 RepID=UPI0011AA5AA7|nr:hypothetical protein [Bacillus pumilus]
MINFLKYNCFYHYDKNWRDDEGNIDINRLTLIRNAITVGLGSKKIKNLNKDLLDWKVSNILTFIDSDNGYSFKNLDNLESTEKVTVAYYIGMVFAQIYMQQKHKTRFLLHLNSPEIKVTNYPNKFLKPDFFGIDNKRSVYLIEAKGTLQRAGRFTTLDNIRKAVEQLEAVNTVEYHLSGNSYIYSQHLPSQYLNKFVIATHPNALNKGNIDIKQHIIEVHQCFNSNIPYNPNENSITFDINKTIYHHYIALKEMISIAENNTVIELRQIPGTTFRMISLNKLNCSIGLSEEIYQILNTDAVNQGLYEQINSTLDRLEMRDSYINQESFSLGYDGIIVIDNNMKEFRRV